MRLTYASSQLIQWLRVVLDTAPWKMTRVVCLLESENIPLRGGAEDQVGLEQKPRCCVLKLSHRR